MSVATCTQEKKTTLIRQGSTIARVLGEKGPLPQGWDWWFDYKKGDLEITYDCAADACGAHAGGVRIKYQGTLVFDGYPWADYIPASTYAPQGDWEKKVEEAYQIAVKKAAERPTK